MVDSSEPHKFQSLTKSIVFFTLSLSDHDWLQSVYSIDWHKLKSSGCIMNMDLCFSDRSCYSTAPEVFKTGLTTLVVRTCSILGWDIDLATVCLTGHLNQALIDLK